MTNAPADLQDFARLAEVVPDETVTHVHVSDHALPREAGTVALLTLDNEKGPRRPATLGPRTLIGLAEEIDRQAERARAGEIQGLALTGVEGTFAAGADLSLVAGIEDVTLGRDLARLGHAAYDRIAAFPAPTLALVNGVALGGGLELALAADYRVVHADARGFGLPEVRLGLIPGWSGVWRVPSLIGPEAAVDVVLKNPLDNNRLLSAVQAHELGLFDLLASTSLTEEGLDFLARVIAEDAETLQAVSAHRDRDTSEEAWATARASFAAVQAARPGAHLPARTALEDLFFAAEHRTREESAAAEADALEVLIASSEFRRTVYAFLDLVQRRAKQPVGDPGAEHARALRVIGVVGAGLMAAQLALLFAQKMPEVRIEMTEVDEQRAQRGAATIESQVQALVRRGRLGEEQAQQLAARIRVGTDQAVFAEADLVIEAVFEDLEVKRQVFAAVERHVSPTAVLATNTSSLSVAAMAEALEHPERLVGFHVFNPVAQMPLVEIVRTADTDDAALATAFALARGAGKSAVLVQDAAGFVVNRVLMRLMGEVQASFDAGTPAEIADHAVAEMALPMTPFTLAALVGLPVAQHVSESLNASFGAERFPVSDNVAALIAGGKTAIWAKDVRTPEEAEGATGETIPPGTAALLTQGKDPQSGEELLTRVQDALAEEIGLILDEGVVASAEDVDLCMILGAGWPLHLGGITPYLDGCGASERVRGVPFHGSRSA
ncbi:MAG: 3-hydroxyacyl-CoA dehydrogenase NAD-binding domain-containing protein [Micrococcus sp.]|nr:3-hydroxyacyl-CoA dehydrogenase NAD-binding domain-containing protein [Micrococcus sp.]